MTMARDGDRHNLATLFGTRHNADMHACSQDCEVGVKDDD